MEKVYLVVFADPIKREELKSYIESLPDIKVWFFSIPQSMFVVAGIDANSIYKKIASRFSNHGNLFVTEVPRKNCQGWMPASHWKLIDDNSIVHSYNLKFDGYWREGRVDKLPPVSGIYCVYAGTYNKERDTVDLNALLYIGQSVNIHDRHLDHEAKKYWKSFCTAQQELCYTVAPLAKKSLYVAEAAMIFQHKPICNDQLKDSFPYGKTKVVTTGCNAKLYANFIIG